MAICESALTSEQSIRLSADGHVANNVPHSAYAQVEQHTLRCALGESASSETVSHGECKRMQANVSECKQNASESEALVAFVWILVDTNDPNDISATLYKQYPIVSIERSSVLKA